MSKLYITGVSGTGKSTLTKELSRRGVYAFDIDDIPDLCHWRNRKTKEEAEYTYGAGRDFLDAHDYICDQSKLEKLLEGRTGHVAVAGLTSNQADFMHLFDKVFLLHCKEETFINRLNTRGTNNEFGKDKSEQEQILGWYKNFEDRTIKSGAIPVSSDEPTRDMADKIMSQLNN